MSPNRAWYKFFVLATTANLLFSLPSLSHQVSKKGHNSFFQGGVLSLAFGIVSTATGYSLLSLFTVPPPSPCQGNGAALSNTILESELPLDLEIEGEWAPQFKAYLVQNGCTVGEITAHHTVTPVTQLPKTFELKDLKGLQILNIHLEDTVHMDYQPIFDLLTQVHQSVMEGSFSQKEMWPKLKRAFDVLKKTLNVHFSLGNKSLNLFSNGKLVALVEKSDSDDMTLIILRDPKSKELLAKLEKPSTLYRLINGDLRSLIYPQYHIEINPDGRAFWKKQARSPG